MSNLAGPQYATAATAGADWSTVSNAIGAADGAVATNTNEGPGGGGHSPSQLITSGHGFAIPSTGVIDGIMLEAKVYGDTGSNDQTIQIGKTGKTSIGPAPNYGQFWPSVLTWFSWGGPTSLWGRTDWTPADINDSSFGGSLSAMATHATGTISIDSVRITVYWHTGPAEVPKRYTYKVYNNGSYLGNLPQPINDFSYSQELNTGGGQISVQVPISIDTAGLPSGGAITDESGVAITDETTDPLLGESATPPVALGTGSALIKNGNQIVVWEYGYYNPNGRIVFQGQMQRWEATHGGDSQDNSVTILCYSDGQDLDNFLLLGSPFVYTVDQSQTSQNASTGVNTTDGKLYSYNNAGQSFTVGTGVTNLGGIYLLLNGSATVTVTVYASSALGTVLASSTVGVSVGSATEILFGFANHIIVTPGTSYFFSVTVDANQGITIYYSNANPYAGGQMYTAFYGGGSGGGSYSPSTGSDLYFKTASSNGQTIATFTSQDPTTGMLAGFMADYHSRGGVITAPSGNIQATGLSLTYTFNTNTIYEGIQAVLSLSPNGFYYYVDMATDQLTFKQASTSADILLVRGKHISKLTIIATIENTKNLVFFSGGTVSGSNIYAAYQDAPSIALYGQRLDRRSDNRVTTLATANAIGSSAVAEQKNEQYQTVVTVADRTMDTSQLHVGLVIGFRGFGNFADSLLAQIVRLDYTPESVTMTLGILPQRMNPDFERITRGLVALQTIANPASPS